VSGCVLPSVGGLVSSRTWQATPEDQLHTQDEEENDNEFIFDGSERGEFNDDGGYDKVWVECRAIEDASSRFRP